MTRRRGKGVGVEVRSGRAVGLRRAIEAVVGEGMMIVRGIGIGMTMIGTGEAVVVTTGIGGGSRVYWIQIGNGSSLSIYWCNIMVDLSYLTMATVAALDLPLLIEDNLLSSSLKLYNAVLNFSNR